LEDDPRSRQRPRAADEIVADLEGLREKHADDPEAIIVIDSIASTRSWAPISEMSSTSLVHWTPRSTEGGKEEVGIACIHVVLPSELDIQGVPLGH
jgi:hypothetical protein